MATAKQVETALATLHGPLPAEYIALTKKSRDVSQRQHNAWESIDRHGKRAGSVIREYVAKALNKHVKCSVSLHAWHAVDHSVTPWKVNPYIEIAVYPMDKPARCVHLWLKFYRPESIEDVNRVIQQGVAMLTALDGIE